MNTVLNIIDKDGDGKISLQEFEAIGLDGLPNFEELGAEGHHYDVESGMFRRDPLKSISSINVFLEFFLHHEEQFHSTPETQTDESYNHPEDLEHFAHHEHIEHEEAEREAKYQGITVDEALAQHEPHEHEETQQQPQGGEAQQHEQVILNPHDDQPVVEGFKDPVERLKGAAKAASSAKSTEEWAAGEGRVPRTPSDRGRKNAPYKVLSLLFLCYSKSNANV